MDTMDRYRLDIKHISNGTAGAETDPKPVVVYDPRTKSLRLVSEGAPSTVELMLTQESEANGFEHSDAGEQFSSTMTLGRDPSGSRGSPRTVADEAPTPGMANLSSPDADPFVRIAVPSEWGVVEDRQTLPTIDGESMLIGRSKSACAIAMADDHVSRKHARITAQNGGHHIEDLSSRWGTTINGERLAGIRILEHGDEIRLGKSAMRYIAKPAGADTPPVGRTKTHGFAQRISRFVRANGPALCIGAGLGAGITAIVFLVG